MNDSIVFYQFYDQTVKRLVTRSITGFLLHVGQNTLHIRQLLPDIWVDGKELYQYQTPDDGEGHRYMLTRVAKVQSRTDPLILD